MPCDSSYLEPHDYEKQAQDTAKLLMYTTKTLNMASVKRAPAISQNMYPSREDGDYVTAQLCKILGNLDKSTLEKLVYDAHSKKSRELATWWEKHQAADRKRERDEKAEQDEEKARKSGLSKLSAKERKALGHG